MNGFSIVICCYNSSNRIGKCLSHIASLKVPNLLQAEVIVVDNASTDNTSIAVERHWEKLKSPFPLIQVCEPTPGLSFARKKGVGASKYEYILFCDDDNWLDKDYLNVVFKLISKNKSIGAIGGWGQAFFEEEEPEWFYKYSYLYAVGKQGTIIDNVSKDNNCLYGAGLVIKKSAWQDLFSRGFNSILTDRKGNNLSSGGDTELTYALRLAGYQLWFSQEMTFQHFMPKNRMSLDYLKKLRRAICSSRVALIPYIHELYNDPYYSFRLYRDTFYGIRTKFFQETRNWIFGSSTDRMDAEVYFLTLFYQTTRVLSYHNTRRKIRNWREAR